MKRLAILLGLAVVALGLLGVSETRAWGRWAHYMQPPNADEELTSSPEEAGSNEPLGP